MSTLTILFGLFAVVTLSIATFPNIPQSMEYEIFNTKSGKSLHMGQNNGQLAMQLPEGRLVRDYVNQTDYFIALDGSCYYQPLSYRDNIAAQFPYASKIADVKFGYGPGLDIDHYKIPMAGVGNSYMGVSEGTVNYPVYFRDARTLDDMVLYYNITLGVSNPDMWNIPENCTPIEF